MERRLITVFDGKYTIILIAEKDSERWMMRVSPDRSNQNYMLDYVIIDVPNHRFEVTSPTLPGIEDRGVDVSWDLSRLYLVEESEGLAENPVIALYDEKNCPYDIKEQTKSSAQATRFLRFRGRR